jgi:hypothetical protein
LTKSCVLALFLLVPLAHGASTPPTFKQYLVSERYRGPNAKIQLGDLADAKYVRTNLRRNYRRGVSFAGHYSFVNFQAGQESQVGAVVDNITGRMYGVAGEPRLVRASRGFAFRVSSRLLIADPPCLIGASCLSTARSLVPVRYYVLEPDGLHLVHVTRCHWVGPTKYDRAGCF